MIRNESKWGIHHCGRTVRTNTCEEPLVKLKNAAMIVWVKYGFDNMPLKMYNTNVSCAILLSFLKATCVKDIDEYCKQKSIQLSIELDAIRRALQQASKSSLASVAGSVAGSRPASGASSGPHDGRPKTPQSTRSESHAGEEISEASAARAKKELFEKQLDIINTAAKHIKELIAGVCWLDLVDSHGNRMNVDAAGNDRANTILTARQQYSVVSVSTST
ncbi:hypothetical protein Poli38472_004129 [Pythium oligandrum]|uniref:Uncharacterized protein n=1 Tax=Pythium oligandrum TaxID=41045 RepID=A0A8K1CNJ2_PYTOL|nr:hypothetical protein Poli38472_004129 [Pythium oligandrum]|eukprot:TMW66364.1 hypothetical protein Poli38472_004129 [Pythium oligandrum]